ncbi:transmembrane amino acid transporter protein-domain-containing protein [Jimgerdemannia flammicorona]|uniref:Transmembrane amino acid transporter protein-domain-containing protein n=1 Tax=Jimgerdemannia flammicorona TaxID=994334 RepID=A0A433D4X9_9FUNG|nr:transmembrane amino acid transporter protein-domain-containing protein [Jimgerdemannia flammicorona]
MSFSERITNIHPSQHQHDSDDSDTLVGDSRPLLGGDDDANPHRTVTDMLGSFVDSYSRTTMTFMADNISLPSSSYNERLDFPRRRMSSETHGSFYGAVNDDLESDKRSTYSSFTGDHETPISIAQYDDDFGSSNSSRSPLLQPLIPAETAEDFKIHPRSIQSSHVKSTFTQSIFNSINILIGIGILALPLGFRCAGWVVGLTVFVFCCGLTNYTAKLLAKCMDANPSAHTYADIGAVAFGKRGMVTVSILFLAELVAAR